MLTVADCQPGDQLMLLENLSSARIGARATFIKPHPAYPDMIDVRWLPDEHGEMNGGFIARRFARWNDYAQLWMTGKDRWVSGPPLYTGRRAEAVPVAAPVAAFTQGDLDEYGPSLVTVPVHPAVHAIERMHASRPRDGRPQLYIP